MTNHTDDFRESARRTDGKFGEQHRSESSIALQTIREDHRQVTEELVKAERENAWYTMEHDFPDVSEATFLYSNEYSKQLVVKFAIGADGDELPSARRGQILASVEGDFSPAGMDGIDPDHFDFETKNGPVNALRYVRPTKSSFDNVVPVGEVLVGREAIAEHFSDKQSFFHPIYGQRVNVEFDGRKFSGNLECEKKGNWSVVDDNGIHHTVYSKQLNNLTPPNLKGLRYQNRRADEFKAVL